MKLKFYFQQDIPSNRINVYLVGEKAHGERLYAQPMILDFQPMTQFEIKKPTLSFDGFLADQFFPALVAGLAESGYKYESSDAGELKATKIHLQDMRTLVFKEQK